MAGPEHCDSRRGDSDGHRQRAWLCPHAERGWSPGADDFVRAEDFGVGRLLGYPIRRVQEYADAIRREEVAPLAADDGSRPMAELASTDLDVGWLVVGPDSPIAGLSVVGTNLRPRAGVSIVAISRDGAITSTPSPDFVIKTGDEVTVIGNAAQIDAARQLVSAH